MPKTKAVVTSRMMAGVYSDLRGFVLAHCDCGELHGDADPLTPEGYRVWARCSCGAHLERWVTPADAEADLLYSTLLAFEN
jgi:hypothetical protein